MSQDEEIVRLRRQLARFEGDLRALQATRTVRATRLVGQVVGRVRGRAGSAGTLGETVGEESAVGATVTSASDGPTPANYDSWFWERYSLDAVQNAQVWDFDQGDLERSRAATAKHDGPLDLQSLIWFLPPFQHAYYGGVHTILRFAAYFKENKGIDSRFVIVRPASQSQPDHVATAIGEAFPVLRDAPVDFVSDYADLEKLPAADGVVATYWTTAYYALRFNRVRRKFYFMQDYEPLFYPAGTSYALAEAPYRFGFLGLTNTISLQQIYEQQYDGRAEFFVPAVNTNLFRPAEAVSETPFKLFFYGRPGQPRNAFELGAAALTRLKKELGDRVQIVTAGANWSPDRYGLDGVVENLGLLAYEETAALYRTCQAGLVMMFTRHPSYLPFELMASGAVVVTNPNPATAWLLRDRQNCLLSPPSASGLAQTLEMALTDHTLRATIRATALADIRQNYADWSGQIEKICRFMRT